MGSTTLTIFLGSTIAKISPYRIHLDEATNFLTHHHICKAVSFNHRQIHVSIWITPIPHNLAAPWIEHVSTHNEPQG